MSSEQGAVGQRSEASSLAAPAVALFVAILGFLPIANWIRGGHEAPWYALVTSGWLSGSAIAIGVGVVLAILARRIDVLWHDGALNRIVAAWARRPVVGALVVATASLALYVAVACLVFDARPLLIDEMVQVLQAQIYANGALSRPVAPHPEFFSSMHVIDSNGRYFSQFPAGGPAMLLPGVLLGATWLVGPVAAAIAIFAFSFFLRRAEPSAGIAMAATIAMAIAPFAVFMSGSHMNHVTNLMWLVIAMALLARGTADDDSHPVLAFGCGLALGCAATIRPLDAFAFALPAGTWYLARAVKDRRRVADLLVSGLGVALPGAALLWVNSRTTGHPLLFGYEMLWGPTHALGFHEAPWGFAHTPARGLELVNLNFLRLQTYLFETPVPSLVPVIGALALTRRLRALDRYLLCSSALLVGLYFAYWHNGFFLGPRFMYPLLPVLALYAARFLPLLRDRVGSGLPYRAAVFTALCAGAMAATSMIPLRARQYQGGLTTMRWNADSAAAASGAADALVFVRESWGAELAARMWAVGVPRRETELLYRGVDACVLDREIGRVERGTARDTAALERLWPLMVDSSRVIGSPFSPDSTERYLPGTTYRQRCVEKINDDRGGFTLLTPLLLAKGGNNIYARDLGARDSLLLARYPSRPVFLVRPATSAEGEPPRFYPLSRDSLWRAWRAQASMDGASTRSP
jgi:hypothetical protein